MIQTPLVSAPASEPLSASVTVSLTAAEKERLAADAKASGTSMSALARKRITTTAAVGRPNG